MRLLRYVGKRLLYLIPVMLGVLLVTFFVARVLPTDPVYVLLPRDNVDQAMIDQIRRELGLDKPVIVQFGIYVQQLLKGDLGDSFHTGNTVLQDLRQRMPATVELTTIALLLCAFVSIPLGVMAAVRRDGLLDHVGRGLSLVGVAMPSFWLGLMLVYFLFFKLDWFPPPLGRAPIGFDVPAVTGMYTVDTLLAGDWKGFFSAVHYLALPTITLAAVNMAPLARLTRSSMIEVLGSEYVRTARASGVSEFMINYRLALKNALLAPVTMLGQIYGNLLGGTVIIELIFAWPGLGQYAVNAAAQGDYAPVQAFAILAASARVLVFLLTDLIYFTIDPRIRY